MKNILFSIIGIILSLTAGALGAITLQAEAGGYLNVPYVWADIGDYAGNQYLWISACVRTYPYWGTTAEDAYAHGYSAGRCSTIKTINL